MRIYAKRVAILLGTSIRFLRIYKRKRRIYAKKVNRMEIKRDIYLRKLIDSKRNGMIKVVTNDESIAALAVKRTSVRSMRSRIKGRER